MPALLELTVSPSWVRTETTITQGSTGQQRKAVTQGKKALDRVNAVKLDCSDLCLLIPAEAEWRAPAPGQTWEGAFLSWINGASADVLGVGQLSGWGGLVQEQL